MLSESTARKEFDCRSGQEDGYQFATRAAQPGDHTDPHGSLAVPIVATSTFVFGSAKRGAQLFAGKKRGYFYTRISNPTVQAFERKVADLEGAEDGQAFGSGMGAVAAVAEAFLSHGDELVYMPGLYGGTAGFFETLLPRRGVTTVNADEAGGLEAAVTARTRLVYVETPTNPTLRIHDLKKIADVARRVGAIAVADNTFASPYLTRPLEFGLHLSLHSATKYLGGHGNLLGGVLVGSREQVGMVRAVSSYLGACLAPHSAALLLSGVHTLKPRMEEHCTNAESIADFLDRRKDVWPDLLKVHYPGLQTHPGHIVAARQMRRFGGMLSIELSSKAAAWAFLDHLELFKQAVSLGDTTSLACHPASTTHARVPCQQREHQGVTDGLVRLSVGIEDCRDLIDDIEQALSAMSFRTVQRPQRPRLIDSDE
jgi:methionine-gamma-lyase